MAPVTPTGIIGTGINGVRQLIANSAAFKTATSTNTYAGAYAFTFANWLATAPTKFSAIVYRGEMTSERVGSYASQHVVNSRIVAQFEYPMTTSPHLDPQAARTNAENLVCTILRQIEAYAGTTVSLDGASTKLIGISSWSMGEDAVTFSGEADVYKSVSVRVQFDLEPYYAT